MTKRPAYAPAAERRHYVFVARCGCPTGLVEQGSWCKSEDEAWEQMYETRAEERSARARGIRIEFVDHATYERDFYPLMTKPCTHG